MKIVAKFGVRKDNNLEKLKLQIIKKVKYNSLDS